MPKRKNGPDKLEINKSELYFQNGLEATAFLTVWLTDGTKITLELHPRFARLLKVLQTARKADTGINAAGAEGWRSKSQIADAIARVTKYRVDNATITAYASQLLKKIKKTIQQALDESARAKLNGSFRLLERRRGLGVRVADGVVIEIVNAVDPNQNGDAEQQN